MKRIRVAVSIGVVGILFFVGWSLARYELKTAGAQPTAPSTPQAHAATGSVAPDAARATRTVPPASTAGACPQEMVDVEGDYCPRLEQKCLRWLDPELKLRCAEFEPESKCLADTVHKRFCIDTYEYPNKAGEKPIVMKTWWDAKHACEAQGKRLCFDSEWTLACEGGERLPYPYGYVRSADACNIDRSLSEPNESALANPATRDAEAARLDQREASGAREACVSAYGAHDMAGNVDEWVINESGHPYRSGLKGGYWGPVRTRCRPMTVAHYEDFSFYQIGFRCCADPSGLSGKSDSVRRPGRGAAERPRAPMLAGR